jgi:hypothetical protein
MCKWGTNTEVEIVRRVKVDACIADWIVDLNRQGIHTTSCCCGHGGAPATATILPSSQQAAREQGYVVRPNSVGNPEITRPQGDAE